MTQEEHRQQVRKAMATLLYEHKTIYEIEAVRELFALTYPNGQSMIGILAEKQELPESIDHFSWSDYTPEDAYAEAVGRLLEAGWRKVE